MSKLSQRQLIEENYYDAMDLLEKGKQGAKLGIKLLKESLKMDPNDVQAHIGLVFCYAKLQDTKNRKQAIKDAYQNTLKKFLKWPKKMEWADLNNRPYLRAIQWRADLYWDEGEDKKAIELFCLLLKLNPNDNQGVRYEIAGVYAGLKGDDINKLTHQGNAKQDWSALENLVKEQNKKHKFWQEPKFD